MSKSAQLKEQRRKEIREQFLQDLYSEEGSEEEIASLTKKFTSPKDSELRLQFILTKRNQ